MVGSRVATVDDGVTEGAVVAVVLDFGPDAPFEAFGAAGLHFGEVLEVFFDGVVAAGAGFFGFALFGHDVLFGVVCEGFTVFDHRYAGLVELFEVVAGVARLVWVDAHQC